MDNAEVGGIVTGRGTRRTGAALAAMLVLCCPGANASYSDGVAAFHVVSTEAGIRYWRKAAWQQDDFLSELRLADIYGNSADSHYYDPVESYVWYYLASRSALDIDDASPAAQFLHNARHDARIKRAVLLASLDADEREDARERIVYILSCRGASGFDELGRIYDTDYARERPGRDVDFVGITTDSVMQPSDADALLYFHIAESMGDPVARYYLNDIEGRLRGTGIGKHIVDDEARKFHFWSPSYEFYPPGDNDSGIPYSDECEVGFARGQALSLVEPELPRFAIVHALAFLGWGREGIAGIKRFQLTAGDDATGRLTALQSVRLIQTAAVRGDADSQNTLGVMYAKGIGVVRNFVRAQYWFQKAADQRDGAALYHLGVLYKVGPEGIRQDLSRANDAFTAAALAGFRPSMDQLSQALEHAADEPAHPGQH